MAARVRRVFVLGAGASAFAGYPLASGLLDFLKQEPILEATTQKIASEILYKLHHAARQLERETRKKWGLEILLTHLDLYGTVGKLRIFTGDWTDSDRMKVSRVIAHQFQWHQYKINRKVWGNTESNLQLDVDPSIFRSVAEAWADFLQPGDAVVSFNWDLLHESILWRAEKWSYVDGYGFVLPRADENEPLSKVKIYKLHGSVNWVQEEDTDPITQIEFARDFFFGSNPPAREFPPRTAGLDSGRKLILPTYLKDISRNVALLARLVLSLPVPFCPLSRFMMGLFCRNVRWL